MTEATSDRTSSSDPRVSAKIRELHADAISAEFENPIWGALVIAAIALVGLEDELRDARHPKGRGSPGAVD